jgi:ABC-type transporter Mla subunit MlaD
VSRRQQTALVNPVLIGAVTVLVVVIAVFLAYIAASGLPFVPTQELKADLADGANLTIGNDVREGGFLVGLISDERPVQLPDGRTVAQITMQISEKYKNIPVDSQVSPRPLSLLGLKYVDLVTGHSHKYIADGGKIPEHQTRVPVQFDDVLKIFDAKTRIAIQQDYQGFGDALASRGSSLNDLIVNLPRLLGHLEPVAAYLSDPNTGLVRFFDNLERFMGTIAPVAQVNADVFKQEAITFDAIARDPNALEQTIAKSPSTEEVSTQSLIAQQPFLTDSTILACGSDHPGPGGAGCTGGLVAATNALRAALPSFNSALEAGERVLPRTVQQDQELQGVFRSLRSMALAPGTNVALNALTDTVKTLNPLIRYLAPFQTVCDDWNYWWTYLAEHQTAETHYGFAERVLLLFGDAPQPNNVGNSDSTYPVGTNTGQPGSTGPETLHGQTYGAAIDNHGNADCETGQRGYPYKLNYFDPMGRPFATDNHTPGNQGPTFQSIRNGRFTVPAGETFSRNPSTGPQLPYNPTNP